MCPGWGGAGRYGEGEAGQQEDSLQSAAGSRGSALLNVQPQEHGETQQGLRIHVIHLGDITKAKLEHF